MKNILTFGIFDMILKSKKSKSIPSYFIKGVIFFGVLVLSYYSFYSNESLNKEYFESLKNLAQNKSTNLDVMRADENIGNWSRLNVSSL